MNEAKQKETDTTRSRRIEARVSDAELKRIVALAAQCGMTLSNYLRCCALGHRPKRRMSEREMEAQAAEQQETIVTTEQIEALKQLNGTLHESIVELKDAKFRVDDARKVCEDISKRLWGICDGVHAALLRAENTHIKAHIDEKEVKKLSQFAEKLRVAEEQLLERRLEKQIELWHTSLARQRRNLESNEGIWLSKKAFHTWLWFFLLPLCYTIISICYYLAVWFG